MKIIANAIRMGNILEHKGALWQVAKPPEHTMPGKGGAYVQVELKDIKSGTKLNERFRSSESVNKARVDEVVYQFLYREDEFLHLMNNEDFEQVMVSSEMLGEKIVFLQEQMELVAEVYDDKIISLSIPAKLEFEVSETEPVVKGQTATASYKPAILSNDVRVMVPPFINVGDKILINTEDSTYLERVK